VSRGLRERRPPAHRISVAATAAAIVRPQLDWSGWRESNPHSQLGRLELYH
jgi:hypothetical protein